MTLSKKAYPEVATKLDQAASSDLGIASAILNRAEPLYLKLVC